MAPNMRPGMPPMPPMGMMPPPPSGVMPPFPSRLVETKEDRLDHHPTCHRCLQCHQVETSRQCHREACHHLPCGDRDQMGTSDQVPDLPIDLPSWASDHRTDLLGLQASTRDRTNDTSSSIIFQPLDIILTIFEYHFLFLSYRRSLCILRCVQVVTI